MASGPIYQLPIFINNILLAQSHAHSFTYCLWLLLHHSWVVAASANMVCKAEIVAV